MRIRSSGCLTFHGHELEVVVVVGKLQSRLAGHLAGAIEHLRGALPRPRLIPDRLVNPRIDDERVADGAAVFDDLWKLVREQVVADVGRRRGQPVLRERRLHFLRRLVEVAGELDLLVAERRDLRQRAVEVLRHRVAHGVQLHAKPLDAVLLREEACRARGSHGNAGADVAKERTAIQDHGALSG